MALAAKGPPRGNAASPIDAVCLSANASTLARNATSAQDKFRNPRAVREAKLELLRDDMAANACILQIQLNVALASINVPDDVGLLYAMRRARAYWHAISRSARDMVALRDEEAAREHFASLPDGKAAP